MTSTGGEPGADFDRWLRRQLCAALDPELGPRPHPATARYATASRRARDGVTPFRFSIPAALGAKALLGGAIVALAAGTAGTVMTGSVNPTTWGQHISEFVEQCKARDVNVGECVSDMARTHGQQVRAQHSEAVENASASPKPGQREGQDNNSARGGSGAAASNGHGQSQGHDSASPSPTPSDRGHGHGKPSPNP